VPAAPYAVIPVVIGNPGLQSGSKEADGAVELLVNKQVDKAAEYGYRIINTLISGLIKEVRE
jgi:hypothetical protein